LKRRRRPHRIRAAGVHHGHRLTYATLNARANRLARRLRALGVGRGAFVGILDERGLDFLTAMVAILKAGAAFIPIDPGYPEERVQYMISDSRVSTLITRGAVLARFALAGAGDALRELALLDDPVACTHPAACRLHPRAEWEAESAENLDEPGESTDAAYMLYTSGSTGLPKGAIIRHNGAVNHIYGQFASWRFIRARRFCRALRRLRTSRSGSFSRRCSSAGAPSSRTSRRCATRPGCSG